MSARAHACVALLLATLSTAGCLFGCGGKKPASPQAGPSASPPPASGVVAAGVAPQVTDEQAPAPSGMQLAADAAVARALAPLASAVDWSDPDALRLSDEPSPRTEPQIPAVEPAAPEPPPGTIAAADPEQHARHEPRARPAAAGRPGDEAPAPASQGAVANQRLEVSESAARPASAVAVEAEPPAPAPAGHADELSRTFAKRLREKPGDLATHLDYQLLRFLMDEPVPDLDAVAGLPAEDRELLTALIDGLSNFRNGARADNNMLLSKKIRPLLDMAQRVQSQADLFIPTIALCQRVDAFGVYEPMNGRFAAGRETHVLMYCELDNVSSRQNEKGVWESKLSAKAVLYTEAGEPVWSTPQSVAPDVSRNRRRDFYVAQQITLVPNLPIGRYILKATVVDEQVKRIAEASVPIHIVAQVEPQRGAAAGEGPIAGDTGRRRAGTADVANADRPEDDDEGAIPGVLRSPRMQGRRALAGARDGDGAAK